MKNFILQGGFIVLSFFLSLKIIGQPCDNGIVTDPNNPVNNQFVQMGNDFYPGNGTDAHNPWLNQFDWYWGDTTILIYPNQVNWDHNFSNSNDIIPMQHPYGGSMPTEFQYLRPNDVSPTLRDFRWEDGWELLYMNLGYFPDLSPINDPAEGSYYDNHGQLYDPLPSNIPYFVIYNRYRGMLRLFANAWYPVEGNFSDINVTIRFTPPSRVENKLTGLLRHASAYDLPLSEPTSISTVHAPRFHAPNNTQWIVADFQMGYDPCSCQSQGELEFLFTSFNTLDVDILGRSISLDVPINDSTYTTRDFLNMSDINSGNYEPGTEIYQNMDRLADQFEKKQLKYLEDLEEYNDYSPFAFALQKFGVKQAAKFLSGGLSDIIISDSLLTWVENDNWQEATSLEELTPAVEPQTVKSKFAEKAKGLIGDTFGFLAAEIFSPAPTKPEPPAAPVATLEESVYKGTISAVDTIYSSPLIIPGSLPHAYPSGTSLEPHRLPVYNEVLGQAALLETPVLDFYLELDTAVNILSYEDEEAPEGGINCYVTKEFRSKVDLKLKFDEELKIALNNALDFDYDQTNTYVQVNLKVANDWYVDNQYLYDPEDFHYYNEMQQGTNMSLDRQFVESYQTKLEFNSKWVALEDLNQVVFQLLYDEVFEFTGTSFSFFMDECDINDAFDISYFDYEVEQLNIKLMHDMYFHQIGSSNEQVNTLQVFTYQLYNQASGVNQLDSLPEAWSNEFPSGTFDQYIPGVITLGDETITTGHSLVHEVIGDEIFINAQEVQISGPLQVQSGYKLVIQALEKIHSSPNATFNPKILMRIKRDFYDTPGFEYADNAAVNSFCNTGTYQANSASKALQSRLGDQVAEADVDDAQSPEKRRTIIKIFPNPASSTLTIQSQGNGIDRLTIFDAATRPVVQKTPNGSNLLRLDINNLSPGVYIVRADCGGEILTEKLVVTK